ncbi:hypothetical protein O6H91_08G033300 [Diphasiastrum complanatum]|uniref:Uncharacterized protein n=3 Tax=Diphasiastrum complanatum TaxID=34168 RepID=A0ACC2CWE1_DIPCM|nr:hypothetical protein O6H91_08G032200 [Diphasiastrum complanatum]KAJ7546280.1 hypothetical protein O6H91_08G033300 [Diphasiastrum complanatum]KAJ7546281.1 hypothetical protein O6H91_08G033300 [Diphasiastrum complanatum]
MSKIKRNSQFSYKSYVNPLSNPSSHKYERTKNVPSSTIECSGGSLPMHLCHGSSVQCDVVDALRENVIRPVQRPQPMIRKTVDKENIKNPQDISSNYDQYLVKSKEDALTGSAWYGAAWTTKGHSLQSSDAEGETPRFCATPNHLYLWDGSEAAAPAPSWSTLANRSLLCRPLPLDVGRCTCYIVREHRSGPQKPSVYSLYTDEGQGRQDRKLAVACHHRRVGRTEFSIAQSGIGSGLEQTEDGVLGTVTANLVGSRYHIWDQGDLSDFQNKDSRLLLGVVTFEPTVTTLTGSFRKMRAYIPKYQSMQINAAGFQHGNGLTKDWEENMGRVSQLYSRAPHFNRVAKRYELDFRDRARPTSRIKSSVKNFQLTMEENGKQVILLLGKVSKSMYIMEYRFPLTGYQAFSICLASIDSKLCCTV